MVGGHDEDFWGLLFAFGEGKRKRGDLVNPFCLIWVHWWQGGDKDIGRSVSFPCCPEYGESQSYEWEKGWEFSLLCLGGQRGRKLPYFVAHNTSHNKDTHFYFEGQNEEKKTLKILVSSSK